MMFMTSAEIMRPPEFRPPADHINTTVNFFTFKGGGGSRKGLPPKYAPGLDERWCFTTQKLNRRTCPTNGEDVSGPVSE